MTKAAETSYILYVEGVNIVNAIDDTSQLSVRRGGSQLLRLGPQWVNDFFSSLAQSRLTVDKWQAITLGASKGLFFFNADSANIGSVQKQVNQLLGGTANFDSNSLYKAHGHALRHLTFVTQLLPIVETLERCGVSISTMDHKQVAPEDIDQVAFKALDNIIRSLCAHQQFRQPTITLPTINTENSEVCAWDNLRPATDGVEVVRGGGTKKIAKVSAATAGRFNFGRAMKTRLLGEILDDQQSPPVVGDINRLASSQYIDQSNQSSQLADLGFTAEKVAVFYADGNQFGKIFAQCDSIESLRHVTQQLADQRRNFLRALCDELQHNPYGHTHTWVKEGDNHCLKEALRLEILLWGGDEITLVLPAWFGIRAAELFYQHAQATSLDLGNGKQVPFSYASGLVFAQSNTAVNRLETVCKDLAELVKAQKYSLKADATPLEKSQALNGFAYAVFESVDFPTEPVAKYIARHHGLKNELQQILLNAAIFAKEDNHTSPLSAKSKQILDTLAQQTLAIRQLYRLVATIHKIQGLNAPPDAKDAAFREAMQPLKELLGEQSVLEIQTLISELFIPLARRTTDIELTRYHPNNTRPWIHLQELLDYLKAYATVNAVNRSKED